MIRNLAMLGVAVSALFAGGRVSALMPPPWPTLSSAANQYFTLNDPNTAALDFTISESAPPNITPATDLQIVIPSTLPLRWVPGTPEFGGSAAGKVGAATFTAKVLTIEVLAPFIATDTLIVKKTTFSNFGSLAADRLGLDVTKDGVPEVSDSATKNVVQPTISSGADQTFEVGAPATPISQITVRAHNVSPRIFAADASGDIRVRIPPAFNMTWDTSITTATLGGSAMTGIPKCSPAVTYPDPRILRINVTADFAVNDTLLISALAFKSFSAVSAPDRLELVTHGTGLGTSDEDDRTITIVPPAAPAPTLSSEANQAFLVGAPSTPMSRITVTESAAPAITAANDIRIRIPSGFNMTWDPSITTIAVGGSASRNVETEVTFDPDDQTLVIDVTSDFSGNDTLEISGLSFTAFSAPSAADNLELIVDGGTTVIDEDDKTMTITDVVAPVTMSSALDQVFRVGDPNAAISTITVTDGSTPSITMANDIRIVIPATFGMTWLTSDTAAVITWGDVSPSKVSGTVSYPNSRTLLLNVTADFGPGDHFTVGGLSFTGFAESAADRLELIVDGGTTVIDEDDRTIAVGTLEDLMSAADQTFRIGDAATTISPITFTDSTVPWVTAANDFRIRIPTAFNMVWDTSVTTAGLSGTAMQGTPKCSTAVTYEGTGNNKVLRIDVTADFAPGNTLVISGLKFVTFSAVSAQDNLEAVVSGTAGGATVDEDGKYVRIGTATTMLSAANQVFRSNDPATAISTITLTDSSYPLITTANDIRIRIPATFDMDWVQTMTTANLGGTASSKVSTTASYPDPKTLLLNVTGDFTNGQTLTIAGLSFTGFGLSPADNLELIVGGAGAGVQDEDAMTITVASPPTLASTSDQFFTVGDPAMVMTTITVTESAIASITAAGDLKITIPATFPMTWETSLTTAVLGGNAASKVSATVSFQNGGRTAVLDVTGNFAANEVVTIGGLSFANFLAGAPAEFLTLESDSDGSIEATDTASKSIGAPSLLSGADQAFLELDPPTPAAPILVADGLVARIAAANDIRIRIPAGFPMTWDVSRTAAVIAGPAAAKVAPAVTYEDGGRTALLDVTADFTAGQNVTINGLGFANFAAAAAEDHLELEVNSLGTVADVDVMTISIAPLGGSVQSGGTCSANPPDGRLAPVGAALLAGLVLVLRRRA